MNIILLGPQGSGKGTQARLLVSQFGLFYVCAGDILRDMAKNNPEVKDKLDKGELFPDSQMLAIITGYLEKAGATGNILFDGYPRNIEQYQLFKSWLDQKGQKIDLVIVITISEEETIRRLSARREDPATGKIYNLITELPGPEINQATLVQRDDDKPEAIKKRLGWYRDSVLPLLEVLKKETKVMEVNGERPVEEIFGDLKKEVEGIRG